MARSTDEERSTNELAPSWRTSVTRGPTVPFPMRRVHRHTPGAATGLLLSGGWRFHGNQVMRATRLQLAVIRQRGLHVAALEDRRRPPSGSRRASGPPSAQGGMRVPAIRCRRQRGEPLKAAAQRPAVDPRARQAGAVPRPATRWSTRRLPGQRRSNRDGVGLGEQDRPSADVSM